MVTAFIFHSTHKGVFMNGGQVQFAVKGVNGSLSVNEIAMLVGLIIGSILLIILVFGFFCDIADVKSFSFRRGFTFYAPGETKKKRFYHKQAHVAKRGVKK